MAKVGPGKVKVYSDNLRALVFFARIKTGTIFMGGIPAEFQIPTLTSRSCHCLFLQDVYGSTCALLYFLFR